MEERIQLNLVGITYNQIESGVYALILEDVIEGRRLAIVIGYPEAQSIECQLRNVRTSRPLSHDLMVSLIKKLGAKLLSVDIHRLASGPYAGKITLLTSTGDIEEIDARSSDAVAIAIRLGAPIFTTRQLIDKEGYLPKAEKKSSLMKTPEKGKQDDGGYGHIRSSQELEQLLEKLVKEENYEEAGKIKQELDKRKSNDGLDINNY